MAPLHKTAGIPSRHLLEPCEVSELKITMKQGIEEALGREMDGKLARMRHPP